VHDADARVVREIEGGVLSIRERAVVGDAEARRELPGTG